MAATPVESLRSPTETLSGVSRSLCGVSLPLAFSPFFFLFPPKPYP